MTLIPTVSELKSYLETSYSPETHLLLDVRSPEEYAQGHIDGASNLNAMDPQFLHNLATLDASKVYIVYCQAGGRAKYAAGIMESRGLSVMQVQEGMSHWLAAGY